MKICFLVNLHCSASQKGAGGMEISGMTLLKSLINSMPDYVKLIVVIVPKDNELSFLNSKVRIENVENKNNFENIDFGVELNNKLIKESLKKIFSKYQIDILIDQSSCEYTPLICHHYQVKCVRTIRLQPKHICYTKYADFIHLGIHISKFGFDNDPNSYQKIIIRDYIEIPNKTQVLCKAQGKALTIGRVNSKKGADICLEVAKEYGLSLRFVGEVLDYDFVKSTSSRYNVDFSGYHSRQEVLEQLSRVEYLIWCPRELEANGRVVIEALKLNVKVLGIANGIIDDIINHYSLKPINRIKINNNEYPLYEIKSFPKEYNLDFLCYGRQYWEEIKGMII